RLQGDWSSDVCLPIYRHAAVRGEAEHRAAAIGAGVVAAAALRRAVKIARIVDGEARGGIAAVRSANEGMQHLEAPAGREPEHDEIGRASCRERERMTM